MTDLEDSLLGPIVPGRECGECVACCRSLKVDTAEFSKPAGVPCPHNTGSRCGIHSSRPDICRTWFCAWRRIAAMPEAARPDRSGILAFLGFNRQPRNCLEGVYIVAQASDDEAFDTAIGRAITADLSTGLVPVWTTSGTAKTLVHPRGEVARAVIDGSAPASHLEKEVEAWRTRYEMFR
jgi:Fe-S-cluster containining protein